MTSLNKTILIILLGVPATLLLAADPEMENEDHAEPGKGKWEKLLQKDYSENWEVFLGVPHGSVADLEGVNPDSDGKKGIPLGLGNDPKEVFKIEKEGKETVLHISGQIYGGLTSKEEYENYHLQLQFKWGEKIWPPRIGRKRDSGLLYHCVGEHGTFWNVWMRSQEFQIQEGDTGDYYGLAGTEIDIPSFQPEGEREFIYARDSSIHPFSSIDRKIQSHCNKGFDNEKPNGEWNTLELICIGSTSIHKVNGKVVMVLYNSRHAAENGELVPLSKGKIQIQSEAAEVYYKNINIRMLDETTPLASFLK
ncbi:MAG: DUF1080 domain-containing protein [Cyclobacteriaceae bacterium]